jgi:hypothetical protein
MDKVRYSVVFRNWQYDEFQVITHDIRVQIPPQEDDWGKEIVLARNAAIDILKQACDNGLLAGDHMDYDLVSTRKLHS